MKLFKLLIHPTNFSDASLLINLKDWPQVQVGNIFQVYLPEDEYSRLLLQVQGFQDDIPPKEAISIEQSIASSFHLRAYAEVVVEEVSPKDVALDSVELFFKDQYLTRSDMWRLKESLINTCVYSNKKIEYSGVRCQVYEMWSKGERVACGVLTEDTKIVYRSASSMVYLFIQMSKEMWDFDMNGDLYFEKTVNGFLAELFAKWKKLNCNHDVTIVLFSRTFYEASSIEEFPPHMRECLQRDYKGRVYEDFYRVAVQNERYEDWNGTLILLKNIFNRYQDLVLEHHKKPGVRIPRAHNATSSQGNFLEVLNMSLNVFEKHYMDRSFDRTGQLSVVISPGVGVFEVDRGLTNVTKQRIIDNGIGSDLVCLGEQPLHAVPLFKFHNKQRCTAPLIDGDNYNMPHWINLSFYCSTKHINYSKFVPRIKLPTPFPKSDQEKNADILHLNRARHSSQPEHAFPSKFDYEDYDNQIFKLPLHALGNKTSPSQLPGKVPSNIFNCAHQNQKQYPRRARKEDSFLIKSEPGFRSGKIVDKNLTPQRSGAIVIPQRIGHHDGIRASSVTFSVGTNGEDDPYEEESSVIRRGSTSRGIVGSAGSTYERPASKQLPTPRLRALINPFDPSHVTIKLTSNRRRWTHVFPLGPSGIFMQQHHYQVVPQNTAATLLPSNVDKGCHDVSQIMAYTALRSCLQADGSQLVLSRHPQVTSTGDSQTDRNISWLLGGSGEQEWTSALTTGVDWKSLVIPACLPITTDYFPDERSLQMDYVVADYSLLPEDIGMESVPRRCFRDGEESHYLPQTALQVCRELVYQRLQQGFQVVILPKEVTSHNISQGSLSLSRGNSVQDNQHCYLLSIGRIYHKVSLDGSKITVIRFKPRHENEIPPITYCYRFQAPDNETYGVSRVEFVTENLHNYAWNHLDNYVCHRGTGDYQLKESQKFWRLRLLLLPSPNQATKLIIDGHAEQCDIYQNFTPEEKAQQSEQFLRFIDIVNRIRRPVTKRDKLFLGCPSQTQLTSSLRLQQQQPAGLRRFSLGTSSFSSSQIHGSVASYNTFRERVGSTGAASRARTGAKALDRVKADLSSTGRISSTDSTESRLSGSNTSLDGSNEAESDIFTSEIKRLLVTSPSSDIIDAMKHPTDGLTFIKQPGLPQWTFVSAEAVLWMQDHIEGLLGPVHAQNLLQRFMVEKLIKHSSGVDHELVYGFYLYYFTDKNSEPVVDQLEQNATQILEMFQREWAEVEVLDPTQHQQESVWADSMEQQEKPVSSTPYTSGLKMEICNMNFPASGRSEWGQIKYHSYFQAGSAYELILEWMVASGNIVADLVVSWARKVISLGFHVVPIPSDPFALSSSSKSDPLRRPTFVPLHLKALTDNTAQNVTGENLHTFQQHILLRFGFILHSDLSSEAPVLPIHEKQYVHVSGSIFVIILPGFLPQNPKTGAETNPAVQVGFMCSWNYMITKRWKSQSTGDEHFMRKVLNDFKQFCSNQDNRLQEFWESYMINFSSVPLPSAVTLPFPD